MAECLSEQVSWGPRRGVEPRVRDGFWTTEDDMDPRALRDAVVVDPSTPLEVADLLAVAMQDYYGAERPYGRIDFTVSWWRHPGEATLQARISVSAPDARRITYELRGWAGQVRILTQTVDTGSASLVCSDHRP